MEKEWDISTNENEALVDLKETKDGGYAVVGAYDNKATILKYDRDGKRLWQNSIEEGEQSAFLSLAVADDGSSIAVGVIIFPEKTRKLVTVVTLGLIAKYDESGKLLWSKTYDSIFTSVIVTRNNEIVVVGAGIVKYDQSGKLLNEAVYEKSVFFTLDEGSDGFVVTGIVENGGSVLLYDEHLNLKWAKNNLNSFSVASDGIKFLSYVTFKNGNIIVTGPSFNGNFVVVLETTIDSEGNILGQKEIARETVPIEKTNEGKIVFLNQEGIQITNSDNDILKIDKAIFGSIIETSDKKYVILSNIDMGNDNVPFSNLSLIQAEQDDPDISFSRIYKYSPPKHKVTVLDTPNGEGKVEKTEYYFGDRVEILTSPDLGYELKKVTVKGSTFNEVINKKNGK